jgi:hypothetical protein
MSGGTTWIRDWRSTWGRRRFDGCRNFPIQNSLERGVRAHGTDARRASSFRVRVQLVEGHVSDSIGLGLFPIALHACVHARAFL